MIIIKRIGQYDRMFEELVQEDPELLDTVRDRVKIFRINPRDTRLQNHQLHRRMKGKWSFSVTDDIRIVYRWLEKTTVRFLAIGHHGKVYSPVLKVRS